MPPTFSTPPSTFHHPVSDALWTRGWAFCMSKLIKDFDPGSREGQQLPWRHTACSAGVLGAALAPSPEGGLVHGELRLGRPLSARSQRQLTSAPHTQAR